jgi:hypothetical protein
MIEKMTNQKRLSVSHPVIFCEIGTTKGSINVHQQQEVARITRAKYCWTRTLGVLECWEGRVGKERKGHHCTSTGREGGREGNKGRGERRKGRETRPKEREGREGRREDCKMHTIQQAGPRHRA